MTETGNVGHAATLAEIFVLLDKLESDRHGLANEATTWLFREMREAGADVDWRSRPVLAPSQLLHNVAILTGCDPDLVREIGCAVLLPNRPALVLELLQQFARLYPGGRFSQENLEREESGVPVVDHTAAKKWVVDHD
jgi:hypothetical protein